VQGEPERTRIARRAAETALVRVVHHYGSRPEFVVLGGLVPELLCSTSEFSHTGTTDIDVQVDLEIASGTVNARRLERALRNAEFEPDAEHVWRWAAASDGIPAFVMFELLTDLEDQPGEATVVFDDCDTLGAVNLRGSRFASRDLEVRSITARVGDDRRTVEINVAGLAGFLLAKNSAARTRRKPKDWYDLAFVLLHNDEGGSEAAARSVLSKFENDLPGAPTTALRELRANFVDSKAQGARAYVAQMLVDHPESDHATLSAEAVTAVDVFCGLLLER